MLASEVAYVTLREEIVSGRLVPGDVLAEVEQAARLGVSRTPLRAALVRLQTEGLAAVGKGRTLVVSSLSAEDVRHLYELREALETRAAALAAGRRDGAVFAALADRFDAAEELLDPADVGSTAYYALVAELDDAIDTAVANPHLLRALTAMRGHVARARRFSRADHERLRRAAEEHALIARAIAEGDAALASAATSVHLRTSLTRILAALDAACPSASAASGTASGSAPEVSGSASGAPSASDGSGSAPGPPSGPAPRATSAPGTTAVPAPAREAIP